jgi:hypothetical protein
MDTRSPTRRRLFAGAAVTLALPFLPSLVVGPRRARAASCAAPPKRFVAWYTPNGFHMPDWTPTTTGKGWALTPILEPLAPVRSKVQVITGLDNHATARPGVPPGNHGGGTGCFLTQIRVNGNFNFDPNRHSLDQVIADHLTGCTPLPSLQLGIESSNSTGSCDGAPCAFSRSISWSRGTARPNVTSPQGLWDRLFAGSDGASSEADARRRRVLRASVLDHVRGETTALAGQLAAADRRKLEEFTTGLRDLEARLQRVADAPPGACAPPARPGAARLPVAEHIALQAELMALAFQCDLTRVATFMIANSATNRDHAFIGAPGGFHGLSHHQGDRDKWAKLRTIGRWEVEQFAAFCRRLDAMSDGNGKTVLDNTCIFFSSEIADGDRHNHWDRPVILAGGLGGTLAANGQHVSYTRMNFPRPLVGPQGGPKIGDLFLSILRGFGISAARFGENGTKPLQEVLS